MVVISKEEAGDPVALPEPAGLVEGQGQGTVPGAHQQPPSAGGPAVPHRPLHHGAAVAPAMKGRLHRQILDLEHARGLLRHHAHRPEAAVVQRRQDAPVQIPVDHVLLLVPQQQQGEKVPLFCFNAPKL